MRGATTGHDVIPPAMRKQQVCDHCNLLFHHFGDRMAAANAARSDRIEEDSPVPRVTRSTTAVEEEDWTVDTDAAACKVTDVRRLDRYFLEHIFTLPEKSRLLMLVDVKDDHDLFGGIGAMIDAVQQNGTVTLGGREYYCLRCELCNVRFHTLVVSGVASKMYTAEQFEKDFHRRQGCFQVGFHNSDKTISFTWKQLMANPMSLMLFGPPLSTSRSFDSIF